MPEPSGASTFGQAASSTGADPSPSPLSAATPTTICTQQQQGGQQQQVVGSPAGLVGADGATHAGAYDLAFLGCLPGMVIMAPSDEAELRHMVATATAIDDRPSAIRYPRGEGTGVVVRWSPAVKGFGKGASRSS